DDEATLSEEEELAKKEKCDTTNEINLLQQESEMPIEELLARYKKEASEVCISDSASASLSSDDHTEDCKNDKDAQFIEST
ncbi:hypothetical protein, partial [Mycobacterium tuberculosis]|uniref:hypothetical protein n=1 Tax=Mycobacterium tuberculosis TaxID=1773 RepID=UPI00254BC5F5